MLAPPGRTQRFAKKFSREPPVARPLAAVTLHAGLCFLRWQHVVGRERRLCHRLQPVSVSRAVKSK
jgi:hypothetical protein